MSEPTIDPERLAALLDGRLDERQRADLLAQLASSDVALEIFADVAAVGREPATAPSAERSSDLLHVRPHAPALHGRRVRWLALVAIAAGLVTAPVLWTRLRAPAGDPAAYAGLLHDRDAGLPTAWDGRPWSTTRAAGDPLTAEARAARIGARLVDFTLAVQTRDTRAGELASEIAGLLDEVPAGGVAAAVYRELSARLDATPEARLHSLLAQGREAVTALPAAEIMALGAWAESARIAAARRDVAFFGTRESRAALDRAATHPHVPTPARGVAVRLRSALRDGGRGGAPDWPTLTAGLTDLLGALGS